MLSFRTNFTNNSNISPQGKPSEQDKTLINSFIYLENVTANNNGIWSTFNATKVYFILVQLKSEYNPTILLKVVTVVFVVLIYITINQSTCPV